MWPGKEVSPAEPGAELVHVATVLHLRRWRYLFPFMRMRLGVTPSALSEPLEPEGQVCLHEIERGLQTTEVEVSSQNGLPEDERPNRLGAFRREVGRDRGGVPFGEAVERVKAGGRYDCFEVPHHGFKAEVDGVAVREAGAAVVVADDRTSAGQRLQEVPVAGGFPREGDVIATNVRQVQQGGPASSHEIGDVHPVFGAGVLDGRCVHAAQSSCPGRLCWTPLG